jgi:hypothetical protein
MVSLCSKPFIKEELIFQRWLRQDIGSRRLLSFASAKVPKLNASEGRRWSE